MNRRVSTYSIVEEKFRVTFPRIVETAELKIDPVYFILFPSSSFFFFFFLLRRVAISEVTGARRIDNVPLLGGMRKIRVREIVPPLVSLPSFFSKRRRGGKETHPNRVAKYGDLSRQMLVLVVQNFHLLLHLDARPPHPHPQLLLQLANHHTLFLQRKKRDENFQINWTDTRLRKIRLIRRENFRFRNFRNEKLKKQGNYSFSPSVVFLLFYRDGWEKLDVFERLVVSTHIYIHEVNCTFELRETTWSMKLISGSIETRHEGKPR